MYVGSIIVILLTGINSIQDIRKREIFFFLTIAVGVAGVIWSLSQGANFSEIMIAFVPGIMLILLSVLTKGKIGIGDAVILLAIGCWRDVYYVFFVLLTALMIASAAGIFCIINKKRKIELPFVPFLFAGCLLRILLV